MSRGFVVSLGTILTGALLVLGWSTWLEERDPSPAVAEPAPDGASELAERLRREAELEVVPRDLEVAGREAGRVVEARLDAVAARLEPGATDWRPVFDVLSRLHPQSEEAVLELYRAEIGRAEAFVRARELVPLPTAPLVVETVDNPILRRVFPLALYLDPARLGVVLRPPRAAGPSPDYLANHCDICVPPLAVHEGYPGHHVAFSLLEAEPGDPAAGRRARSNMTYQEGWGQYAELLMLESGYWADDPARELGALRLVLLRALRAEVDGALASGRLDEEAATALYVDRLRMTPGAARAEVAGHREEPGRKSAYLAGALQILALREALTDASGGGTVARELHAAILRRADPLPVIARDRFRIELGSSLPPAALLASILDEEPGG